MCVSSARRNINHSNLNKMCNNKRGRQKEMARERERENKERLQWRVETSRHRCHYLPIKTGARSRLVARQFAIKAGKKQRATCEAWGQANTHEAKATTTTTATTKKKARKSNKFGNRVWFVVCSDSWIHYNNKNSSNND